MKFKSYYVVWKLGWSEQDEESNEKFKSYYVVWKQTFWAVGSTDRTCLNRTM